MCADSEKKEVFMVGVEKEAMRAVVKFLDFAQSHFPFVPDELMGLKHDFDRILGSGCWKHNLMCVSVSEGANRTVTFCPKCNPEYAEKYAAEVKKFYFGAEVGKYDGK